MKKLVFNLSVAKEYKEAMEVSEYWTSRDSKDLDVFAKHRGHTLDDKGCALSKSEMEALGHIENNLSVILEAFASKEYANFKDLKVVYKKSNQGLVGKMFFHTVNKPTYLYFEYTDKLQWFIGGECVEGGYKSVDSDTKTSIYNYLAVYAFMGVFGMDLHITTGGVLGNINVEYKGRDNKLYKLEIAYSNNSFSGLKKNIEATAIGHWLNAVTWASENSVLVA